MTIVLGDRRSGKTTKLIDLANKHDIPIVVSVMARIREIKDSCRRLDKKIPTVITLENLKSGWGCGKNTRKGFLFDDMAWMFSSMLWDKGIKEKVAGFALDISDETIMLPDIKERLGEDYKKEKDMIDYSLQMERRIR